MFYRTPHFGEEVYNVNLFEVYIQFRQKEKIYIINLFKVYIINSFYRTGLRGHPLSTYANEYVTLGDRPAAIRKIGIDTRQIMQIRPGKGVNIA